jgi:hypothetical protein
MPNLDSLISTFAGWLKHRRELNEMRRLDRAEFDRIASDLRVSPDDLDELVRHGSHAADELPQLLKVLGIDEGDLAGASRFCFATWSVSARCASRSTNATTISLPAPRPNTTRATASTRRRSSRSRRAKAFSSEVDTGSHEKSASKREARASVLIQSEPKL